MADFEATRIQVEDKIEQIQHLIFKLDERRASLEQVMEDWLE